MVAVTKDRSTSDIKVKKSHNKHNQLAYIKPLSKNLICLIETFLSPQNLSNSYEFSTLCQRRVLVAKHDCNDTTPNSAPCILQISTFRHLLRKK